MGEHAVRCRQRGLSQTISRVVVLALVIFLQGCTASAPEVIAEPGAVSADATPQCAVSENLIQDPTFAQHGESSGAWRTTQHAGETSFALTVNEGALQIERIASQPWMLFFQDIQDERLRGATVRYSAELKANLPAEPKLHGFEHKGGLYTQVGRQRSTLAEHEPNQGVWDWQIFSTDLALGSRDNKIRLGFNHQAGGTLWARNPSLVIIDCN